MSGVVDPSKPVPGSDEPPPTPPDPADAGDTSTPAVDAHATGRRLPVWLAAAAAALAGGALVLAFPRFDMWWAAPIGVALLAVATHRQRVRRGFRLGLLAGLVFFAPLLHWTAIDERIGSWPWLLLAGLQAVFVGLIGAAGAGCSRLLDRRLWCWPLVTGLLWGAGEALRARQPFGGFPWGRLAFSQADSPLAWWATVGGAPLVSFAVAAAGGLLAAAGWQLAGRIRPTAASAGDTPLSGSRVGAWSRVAGLLAAAALTVMSGLALPYHPPAGKSVTVAIVQGNVPRLGLDFNAQRRAVLDNHVTETLRLAEQVRQGTRPAPDLVVWPENASDIDPLANQDAAARINEAATAIGVPILVGAVLSGPGEYDRNAGVVWSPRQGPGKRYVKQHPVPFAEYLPMRGLVEMVTDKAELAGNFMAGKKPGVLRVGPAVVGDVICFEVAYDNLVRDTVTRGAGLI
ncbi:MAG: apolipoprotein N-acyltransferase, partial [Micromonosporaceae bacterium]